MKLGLQTAGAFLLTVTLATAASTQFVSGRSQRLVVELGNDAIQQPELVRNTDLIQLRRFGRGNHRSHMSCIYNSGT